MRHSSKILYQHDKHFSFYDWYFENGKKDYKSSLVTTDFISLFFIFSLLSK